MHVKRIAQYRGVLPPGRTILVALAPFPVDNFILEEEEVDCSVLFLQQNRAGIPYGMRVEHLQSCLQSKTRKELSDPAQWGEVVVMIQSTLREVNLEDEFIWKTTVLVSKGNGKF